MSFKEKIYDLERKKPKSFLKTDWKALDILDSHAKKSVAQQVLDIMNNSLAVDEARFRSLNQEDIPDDVDLDDVDTGLDEYSDPYDIDQSIDRLQQSLRRCQELKEQQQKQQKQSDPPVQDGQASESSTNQTK